MDRQNPNTEKHVPTEAEIARLEAEAAAALQRDEAIPRRDAPDDAPVQPAPKPEDPPARPDFVPYVDDVPRPASSATDEEDDDDDDYIPSEMEKRIAAMTPRQWQLWQILGGGAIGIAIVVCLFGFGPDLATYGLIMAALMAIILPRYLERAWRCKLNTARLAMIVTMVIGLIVMFIVTGMRNGFSFKA